MGKGTCRKTVIKESERRGNYKTVQPDHDRVESESSAQKMSYKAVVESKETKEGKETKKEENNIHLTLIELQKLIEENPQNVSITKLVLTKKMASEMVNIRTNDGDSLAECVYINFKNPKSKYAFAISADCYNVFANFFAETIEEIHGDIQKEALLTPQFGNLNENSAVDLNSCNRKRKRALYTEICIRRNIQNIPFSCTISGGERKQVLSIIEKKVRNIMENNNDEVLVPDTWEKRIDAFKNDLDECGTMRSYPNDRITLVFKNDNNIFQGCILNFDDHVQYVASTNDGRIGEVFNKINVFVADASMLDLNYAAHPIFGHLTLSPAHVGTGMNIRVLAKFPFVSRLADANFLLKDYDCIVEHDNSREVSGLLILTNSKTYNTTEENIFKNIVLAFNKLSELEDELEYTTAMAVQDDSMSAEDLKNLFNTIRKNQELSYTKKYLTTSIVSQYSAQKTIFGSTFNNCIRHNAYFPRSLFPRATDANCYLRFSNFFDPILLETNKTKGFNQDKKPQYGSTRGDRRYKLHHPNILSYRVRFNRNFEAFPFPMMMSSKDRADVERIMKRFFEEVPVELEGEYCPIKFISQSIYYEDLLKYRLVPSLCDVDVCAGFCREWPKNRGIFICNKNSYYPNIILVILVNVNDHIKVIALDPIGKSLNICYERAVAMMKILDLRFNKQFAKKSSYGFLTSAPCFVGCGMRVSAHIKLKNLTDKREIFEKECIALNLAYRGSTGQGTVVENGVVDVYFKVNLNITEQYIIIMFVQKIQELMNKERQYDSRIPKPSHEDDSEDSDINDLYSDFEKEDKKSDSIKSYNSPKDETEIPNKSNVMN